MQNMQNMQYNQDDVAEKLMQLPIAELHELLFRTTTAGRNKYIPWSVLFLGSNIIELLRAHGWSISEYTSECIQWLQEDIAPQSLRMMMQSWVDMYYN